MHLNVKSEQRNVTVRTNGEQERFAFTCTTGNNDQLRWCSNYITSYRVKSYRVNVVYKLSCQLLECSQTFFTAHCLFCYVRMIWKHNGLAIDKYPSHKGCPTPSCEGWGENIHSIVSNISI